MFELKTTNKFDPPHLPREMALGVMTLIHKETHC